jgi:hypothetical protein
LIIQNSEAIFDDLNKQMSAHPATQALDKFGAHLKGNLLNEAYLKTFFGTLWAFFREVPTGILALSLKVSDDWMENYDEWEGTCRAAPILYANVDEFGLQSSERLLPTHHQLFIKLMDTLGLNRGALLESKHILPEGKSFGRTTREYYRERSIPEGIGFHMASEFTSSLEFQHFLDGFNAHLEAYGLSGKNKSALSFFQIHTQVEPLHLELGKLCARNYLEKKPNAIDEIRTGMIAFMDGFEKMFDSFNKAFFE